MFGFAREQELQALNYRVTAENKALRSLVESFGDILKDMAEKIDLKIMCINGRLEELEPKKKAALAKKRGSTRAQAAKRKK